MYKDNRFGNTERLLMGRPEDWRMRIPEDVRRNVVFIGRRLSKGSETDVRMLGTGFFVTVPSENTNRRFYTYLVTARHGSDAFAGGDFFARVNKKADGFIDILMPRGTKWYSHPTERETVDVSVAPFGVPEGADFSALPVSMFLTDGLMEERGIGAGDETFIVGLFTKMSGKGRNMPVTRMGNVALIPDPGELLAGVEIEKDKPVEAEAYLVEARSLGGMSGSPAFVSETRFGEIRLNRPDGTEQTAKFWSPGQFFLLGLVHGHWGIFAEDFNEILPRTKKEGGVNVGIAVVVPAKKILEVLYQPKLVAERKRIDDEEQRKEGTTTPD